MQVELRWSTLCVCVCVSDMRATDVAVGFTMVRVISATRLCRCVVCVVCVCAQNLQD